jgi:hypothetical protein
VSESIHVPACADDERRADLVAPPPATGAPFVDLNGISFVEVDPADHSILRVTFLKPLPPGEYGLPADPAAIAIEGGERIVGIRAVQAQVDAADVLRIDVDKPGDYSPYVLTLDVPDLDPVRRSAVFSFMASCPTDVDCRPPHVCPPEELVEPALDYLAKDYASFRRMLLDLLPQLNPSFVERNPSDLGIALAELLAYTGDHISYFQDAVANEAYLDTLRTRISARRHARLVDYRMHDGRNAWAAVCFEVSAQGTLSRGTPLFTRLRTPLPGETGVPDATFSAGAITIEALESNPELASVVAFETAHDATLSPENNTIRVHTWGEEECCLEPEAREAYLYAVPASSSATRPVLADGDYLILEEVLGPRTGARADADPTRRQLVRIEGEPEPTTDPLYARTLVDDELQIRRQGQQALPLLHVRWRRADALRFPICLSARLRDGSPVRNVSVARGNVVLADHGFTVDETYKPEALTIDGRLPLARGPLTLECRPAGARYDEITGRLAVDRDELDCDVRAAKPAVALVVTEPTRTTLWVSEPDLLRSRDFDDHFVAEVDDDGRAVLRFGDDEYGRSLAELVALRAVYRVGNGWRGNVGAESIAHAGLTVLAPGWITAVRNPLPAQGGVDAETIEQVRQRAPQAFHSELFRAVTEADWAEAAQRLSDVEGAVATYRWTGSWTTVFIAVDPRFREDLLNLPDGTTRLEDGFERRVRAFLGRFRLAGYDIELRPPRFVALELELDVCAAPGYFRADVSQAVRDALSAQALPDGTRGFFHPAQFTFGQPVYLSRIYAAVERVDGVDSAAVRVFRRYGHTDAGELERGVLAIGPWEIARLDNDPSFVEHGVLRVTVQGGKA